MQETLCSLFQNKNSCLPKDIQLLVFSFQNFKHDLHLDLLSTIEKYNRRMWEEELNEEWDKILREAEMDSSSDLSFYL